MAEFIRPLTFESLCACAREAAEQHVPVREANYFERESPQWHEFNEVYREREAEVHELRRTGEA